MAENEYLDSTKARRWLSVAEGIRDGCDIGELTSRVQDRFYKTLRSICNDLPFAELVAAVDDPQKLIRLCMSIEGASDVTDFLVQAALQNVGPANVLEQFLGDALQNCLYDIPHLAVELAKDVNLSAARRKMDDARMHLAADLRRIATKLAENPSWKPQRPRSTAAAKSQADNTSTMLSESLIAGFRK
jgi:hypothetical protein